VARSLGFSLARGLIVEGDLDIGFESDDGRYLVRIPSGVAQQVARIARGGLPDETGGLLLGTYSARLSVLTLRAALPPPPDSVRSGRTFIRGVRGLDRLVGGVDVDGRLAVVVGEWHSHPAAPPDPSATDSAQMAWAAARRLFGCPSPVLLIVGERLVQPDDWTVTVYPRWRRPVPAFRRW
jgi:proteasome lid subunit RPN8/RPN11